MKPPLNCIMLIEDCEADTYLHKKIIQDVGVAKEVLIMKCGEDAMRYFRSSRRDGLPQPELLFLDINTPGMEGWDFVEEFAALDGEIKEGIVMIMLSGSLDPDDRERAKALPLIREYRTKPLTRAVLREIMERHFPSTC